MSEPLPEHELIALLALREASGPRASSLADALLTRPDPSALARMSGWRPSPANWRVAEQQARAVAVLGIRPVPLWDLPRGLRRARPAPLLMFVRGQPSVLRRPAVAIVGARQACPTGVAWAWERAGEAAATGLAVVSGGARGVDAAAHQGALGAGGVTLAFVGVPADQIYPASNRHLFARILRRGGALASEHPPGVCTYASDHAMRNRFIAAHARAVLIAEARASSGSLGTAGWARKFSVPVWVSPASVGRQRDGLEWLVQTNRAGTWHAGLWSCLAQGRVVRVPAGPLLDHGS